MYNQPHEQQNIRQHQVTVLDLRYGECPVHLLSLLRVPEVALGRGCPWFTLRTKPIV